MAVPFIDLPHIHQSMRGELLSALEQVLDNGGYIFGPKLEQLEQAMADYCQTEHAVGVASGTDALLVSLMAMDIGPGDEVIVPTFTFFASAGCVWRLGARPAFVDIDPITCNLSPEAVKAAVNEKTKAIMPVHLFGQSAEMDAIMTIAREHDLKVLEDTAQALGGRYHDKPLGSIGDAGALSFFPTKNLGALGDAGMVVTNDEELATKIRKLRHHGQTGPYEHDWVGGNFRLDAMQAAALNVKLPHLPAQIEQRREIACRYNQLLDDQPVTTPTAIDDTYHSFNYYTISAPKRDELRASLLDKKIGCSVYYPLPLHLQPCFAELGGKPGDFPNAEHAAKQVLSLPIFPGMTEAQQDEVVEAIRSFYSGNG